MDPPSMASTYGAWFISLFVETMQSLWYRHLADGLVIIVFFLETTQILFFFRSSYFRFVQHFGIELGDLIWSDSLQLLANYLSAFTVQIYFATRIHRLTRAQVTIFKNSAIGIYVVVLLALLSVAAGTAQTVLTYEVRAYAKLEQTKAITTLQTGASLACDIVITLYLCIFLARNKGGLPRTERMLNALMMNAVNRGFLTALSSAMTMILIKFLVYPGTLWFFLSIAPNSKLYMNSMLATPTNRLNMRHHMQRKIISNEAYSVNVEDIHASGRTGPVSAVEFVHPLGTMDSENSLPAKRSTVSTATLHTQTN
ncbi:hypothetical protein C8F04DRAFT_1257590 [Mycena alexandri]|uniref:DUF6534 domain-containing protein n=1 Tax=Mycena alexandri TaxID=1745969 RepID=A0AAD6T070_9AGAR|nr:hypothetical protein C8F04DRAFT_1257590 [Mycena alexandri]